MAKGTVQLFRSLFKDPAGTTRGKKALPPSIPTLRHFPERLNTRHLHHYSVSLSYTAESQQQPRGKCQHQGREDNFTKTLVRDVLEGHNAVRENQRLQWVKTGSEEECTEEAGVLRQEAGTLADRSGMRRAEGVCGGERDSKREEGGQKRGTEEKQ